MATFFKTIAVLAGFILVLNIVAFIIDLLFSNIWTGALTFLVVMGAIISALFWVTTALLDDIEGK